MKTKYKVFTSRKTRADRGEMHYKHDAPSKPRITSTEVTMCCCSPSKVGTVSVHDAEWIVRIPG